ncbi:uncharacterized protein [Halyomorpha halys]|uniref:uncharacterized protein n=1 Tax=Halyomorpha halys TaxID=286706 RepID=UPI0006D4E8FC|nr:uncharacterized protein LOC106691196 [Halyomorpha halys]
MWLEVMLALTWMECSSSTPSLNGTYNLEGYHWNCHSCASDPPRSEIRGCLCDEACATYGDCCPDSQYFEQQKQRRDASIVCRRWWIWLIYMRPTCPPEWSEPDVRAACEDFVENKEDPIAGYPVTDLSSGITYNNIFCATCHQAQHLDVWPPRITCDVPKNIKETMTKEKLVHYLSFNNETQLWGINFGNNFYPCFVNPVIPKTSSKYVRYCMPYHIKTCPFNWKDDNVRFKCENYTSVVSTVDTSYRNPHCALCNSVALSSVRCPARGGSGGGGAAGLSILFDFSAGPPGMTQPCDDDQLFDPFFKRCRRVLDDLKKFIPARILDFSYTTIANKSSPIIKCKKFLLKKNEYVIEDKTVYVDEYRKRYRDGEFNIRQDGKLEICAESISVKLVEKFSPHMDYITLCGIAVSIVCLVLHLTAFCLVSDLRNLPGKNMASLCVALLLAYTSFVTGRFLHGDACIVVSVVAFYFFLASFTWMLIISFDVWRTLKLSTSHLRVSSGKQWKRFIAYSLLSWLIPALIVMLALWAELSLVVGADWKPGFGSFGSCWFGRSKPLLVFFATPLAFVMLLNIVFFTSSFVILYSTRSARPTATASTQRDFRIYLRLAVMMGLTWTTGIIAGIMDFVFLWYLFTLLNTLQGLFIFLAFTCSDHVLFLIYKPQSEIQKSKR